MTILISGFLFGFLCTVSLLPSTFDQFLRLFGYFFFNLDAGFLRLQSDPFDHPDDTGLLACSVRKHSSNFDLISFHLKSSGAPAVFL